jgi:D-aminopeptidase
LYTNGTYIGATGGPSGYGGSGTFAYVFLGYSGTGCNGASQNAAYQGSIDEVYIHSRELTQTDVTGLANP